MQGLINWVGTLGAIAMIGSWSFVAYADLDPTLKNVLVTEAEKKTGNSPVTPELLVEGKKLVKPAVRIKENQTVYLATPNNEGGHNLTNVYLHPKNGGLYVQESGKSRYLELDSKSKIEKDFLRHFAYVLQQRHPEEPATKKFFERYFEAGKEVVPVSFSAPKIKLKLGEFGQEDDVPTPPTLEQVYSIMEEPSTWTGVECTAERCIFKKDEDLVALSHPGAADLLLKENELLDPSDEKPVEADEVRSPSDIDRILREQPEGVTHVFVLITHKDCGPCRNLKKVGGEWCEFVRKLKKAGRRGEMAAFVENVQTAQFAPSDIVKQYAVDGAGYPQMLIFERSSDGAWASTPKKVTATQIAEKLKD